MVAAAAAKPIEVKKPQKQQSTIITQTDNVEVEEDEDPNRFLPKPNDKVLIPNKARTTIQGNDSSVGDKSKTP